MFDRDGRPRGRSAGTLGLIAVLLAFAVLLPMAVRVVPVGHTLVIFNTVTKGFRAAGQGITYVWPVTSQTHLYDMRRLEYTMSGVSGEGRRAAVDDSLWSPTQEGLQVGIDLPVWHHLDPARVVDIHQRIGPDFEEKIIRPAVRSVIRLVISEYAVMDVYSSKRQAIQDEINVKIKVTSWSTLRIDPTDPFSAGRGTVVISTHRI